MCGIAGAFFPGGGKVSEATVEKLKKTLSRRGPDGSGHFSDDHLFLHHSLLRIFSSTANPGPYEDASGRFLLSFNGEIYNYQELIQFYKISAPLSTDAELILHGWNQEGAAVLNRINGMFAFALWDRKEKQLFLARDPLGEKPLYFWKNGNDFYFSSMVQGICDFGYRPKIHSKAIEEYFQYRYVSGSETAFAGVEKVRPGELWKISFSGKLTKERFWRLPTSKEKISYPEAKEKFRALFEDSIRIRSSYKPLGIFLSGGVDSSGMGAHLGGGSFSFTFCDPRSADEQKVAADFALEKSFYHQEVRLEEESIIWREAILALEEPIADSIQIPALALAKEVSQHTRVVLSGEGADELFGGYVHHAVLYQLDRIQALLGKRAFTLLAGGAKAFKKIGIPLPYPASVGEEGVARFVQALELKSRGEPFANNFSSLFTLGVNSERSKLEKLVQSFEEMRRTDLETWLPDYSLLRLDKTLMRYGVEGRLPYLDKRLVELSCQFPAEAFFHRQSRKFLLRDVVREKLPQKAAFRKKLPFLLDRSKGNRNFPELSISTKEILFDHRILQEAHLRQLSPDSAFLREKQVFALENLARWIEIFSVRN